MTLAPLPRLLLWPLLALPALPVLADAASLPLVDWEDLLAPSGEWSARFLILALMVTPLALLVPALAQPLLRARRAIGVAAFLYALLHLGLYLGAMGEVRAVLAEALAIGIWPGWLAFALMLPLALTSNDASLRALRRGWRRLHRLAYPAALLTLLHWVFVHDDRTAALLHFAPLAVLTLWRVARRFRLPQPATVKEYPR